MPVIPDWPDMGKVPPVGVIVTGFADAPAGVVGGDDVGTGGGPM